MSTGVSDPAFGTTRTIGRYFGVVSAVPTLLLSAYLCLLLLSGAWSQRPDFRVALDALQTSTFASLFGLVGVALVIALVLHTVQFAIVQFLEGYWGGSAVMRVLRAARSASHAERWLRASDRYDEASDQLDEATTGTFRYFRALADQADAVRVIESYPDELDDILPTRLGNLLRKYESRAGQSYGINILGRATHLMLTAPPNHVEYINDQRSALDLAARLCASGIIATVATVTLMWPWDVWLFLALVPYTIAYVSYRGSLVAARHYGSALAALVDLNRFRMYEAMHLHLPTDTAGERALNSSIIALDEGDGGRTSPTTTADIRPLPRYRPPGPPRRARTRRPDRPQRRGESSVPLDHREGVPRRVAEPGD